MLTLTEKAIDLVGTIKSERKDRPQELGLENHTNYALMTVWILDIMVLETKTKYRFLSFWTKTFAFLCLPWVECHLKLKDCDTDINTYICLFYGGSWTLKDSIPSRVARNTCFVA